MGRGALEHVLAAAADDRIVTPALQQTLHRRLDRRFIIDDQDQAATRSGARRTRALITDEFIGGAIATGASSWKQLPRPVGERNERGWSRRVVKRLTMASPRPTP